MTKRSQSPTVERYTIQPAINKQAMLVEIRGGRYAGDYELHLGGFREAQGEQEDEAIMDTPKEIGAPMKTIMAPLKKARKITPQTAQRLTQKHLMNWGRCEEDGFSFASRLDPLHRNGVR